MYELAALQPLMGAVSQFATAFLCCVAYIDTPLRRSITHGWQRNLVLLAFEKSKTEKIDVDELVLRFGRKRTRLPLLKTVKAGIG